MRILTDADGVLLNWEYAFNTWMECHGYKITNDASPYDMGERYGLTQDKKRELVRYFNESSSIGFLPPLRDAIHYIDLLHRKYGYVFHMITSLSNDPQAQELRIANTKKLFGETAFEKFVFLDTGADKDEALAPYRDTGLPWIEDKPENADLGWRMGLNSMLVEHGHNMNHRPRILRGKFQTSHKNWKSIFYALTGE